MKFSDADWLKTPHGKVHLADIELERGRDVHRDARGIAGSARAVNPEPDLARTGFGILTGASRSRFTKKYYTSGRTKPQQGIAIITQG